MRDAGDVVLRRLEGLAVHLHGQRAVEREPKRARLVELQLLEAGVPGVLGQKEQKHRAQRAQRRPGDAEIEQAVVGARLRADAEAPAIGGPYLDGEQVRGTVHRPRPRFRARCALRGSRAFGGAFESRAFPHLPGIRRRHSSPHLPGIQRRREAVRVAMVQQLVEAAFQIERRAGLARDAPALHGVERYGGVEAERQRLHEVAPVAPPHVERARVGARQLAHGLVHRARRHAERSRVVVARAHRHHAERRTGAFGQPQKPVRRLVDDAVAPERHHRAVSLRLRGHLLGMTRPLGQHHVEPVLPHHFPQKRRRVGGCLGTVAVLGSGVRDQQRLFLEGRHGTFLPSSAGRARAGTRAPSACSPFARSPPL